MMWTKKSLSTSQSCEVGRRVNGRTPNFHSLYRRVNGSLASFSLFPAIYWSSPSRLLEEVRMMKEKEGAIETHECTVEGHEHGPLPKIKCTYGN